MSENNTVETQENNTQPAEKTFTQEELNAIVGERLARDREKYADYDLLKKKAAEFDKIEEASKTELEKATEKANALQAELDGIKKQNQIRELREKVSAETGVPANLITGSTEEECKEQAEAIKAYAVPSGYPTIKDGGEPQILTKRTARDDFAAWANAINS